MVTTVYRNSILARVATVPGFAAKKVEDTKFRDDQYSTQSVLAAHGGRHTFLPFAMEDGGRIGAHGQVVLRMLADDAVAKGELPPRPRNAPHFSPPVEVSLLVRRWQQRLFPWLHLTLSRQLLRYLAPSLVTGARYT